MPKSLTPQQIVDSLSRQGAFQEAFPDTEEIRKVVSMCREDYTFGKRLRSIDKPNWRVIFNLHYDVIRELCDQLMRLKKRKTSNHQGVFAFVALNFHLDHSFLETLRRIRNQNKYEGRDISRESWKHVEFQADGTIALLLRELEERT